jgi:hypothetical protein
MLICKDDKSYKCGKIHRKSVDDNVRKLKFPITDHITPTEIKELFEGNKFYFYDEVMGVEVVETHDTKLVGLSIVYNADSTCNITIKLRRRS